MITLIKKKGTNPQDKSAIYFPQWTRVSTVNDNVNDNNDPNLNPGGNSGLDDAGE